MKPVKLNARLVLAKETLRTLAHDDLARVAGGSNPEGGPDKATTVMMEEGCFQHTKHCPRPTTTHAREAPCM
jgi:hypothetical protein